MFKIQILNNIASRGLEQFPQNLYEVSSHFSDPDAILLRSHVLSENSITQSVKIVGRAGAGVNNIPVNILTEKGIPVLNTPGANANAVRELVLAGMLLASRNICQAWNYVHALKENSKEIDKKIEADKKQFVGFELMGRTLGIIGLGSIGVKVANAAIHLGMKVIGFDPTITVNRAWELSSQVEQARSVDELLKVSDFVSLHIPLNQDTKNFIDHSRLQNFKKGAVLLNFSRDGVVDNESLMEALKEKQLFAYVCDFPKEEFKNNPHVISLPHLGASTYEAEENCAVMIVNQLRAFFENGSISNSVNFPPVELSSHWIGTRIVITNLNIPNMVAQISSILAKEELNILSLVNQSRDQIAYTVIDVNSAVEEVLLKKIMQIHGVVKVRKIDQRI